MPTQKVTARGATARKILEGLCSLTGPVERLRPPARRRRRKVEGGDGCEADTPNDNRPPSAARPSSPPPEAA